MVVWGIQQQLLSVPQQAAFKVDLSAGAWPVTMVGFVADTVMLKMPVPLAL